MSVLANVRGEARRGTDAQQAAEAPTRRRLRYACSAFSLILCLEKCHSSAANPRAKARHHNGNRNIRKAIVWKLHEYAYRSPSLGPERME